METKLVIKSDGDQAIATVKALKSELAGIDKDLLKSAGSSKKLSAENSKLKSELNKTNKELRDSQSELSKSRAETERLSNSTKKLSNSQNDLADNSGKAKTATGSLQDTMRSLRNVMLGLAAIRFAKGIINQMNEIGDAALNIDAKLTNATGSVDGINDVFNQLASQSRALGTSVETNVDLFQRLTRATAELGTPQSTILQLTDNINKAFVVSGASAQETRNAIIQLAQGFSAGALRGDEFRSVMEQAPALIDALKESLEVSQGELIEMAFAGELTADKLVKAFTDMGDKVSREAENIPITTERAFENLRTAMIETVRQGNIAADFNRMYAATINNIAENIDSYLTAALTTVASVSMLLFVKGLKASVEWLGRFENGVKNSTLALKALGKTVAIGLIVAGLTYLAKKSREWEEHLEEVRRKASEIPKQLQDSADILQHIKTLNSFDDMASAIGVATVRMAEFTANSDSVQRKIAAIKAEIEALQESARQEALANPFDEFAQNKADAKIRSQVDELKIQLQGLNEQLLNTEQSAFDFYKALRGDGINLSDGNPILEFMDGLVFKTEDLMRKKEADAKAEQERLAIAQLANETIEKQIESITRTVESLELEKVKVFEGVQAYQDLVIAKIQASDASDENKQKLIELTQQQWALEASLKAQEEQTKSASKALKDAQSVLKSLKSEHKPIQVMFEDLAASMQALEKAKLLPEFSASEYQDGMELVKAQAEKIAKEIVDTVKGIYEKIPSLFGNAIKETKDKIDFSELFDGFAEGLNPVIAALGQFKDEIATINKMNFTVGEKAFYKTGLAAEFALNSMASMAKEGSDAQKKLQAAAAITNTILGITAILEQGKGDPYTAFARMAAMAAMVASLGVQVTGAFGGSGGGGAERQQEVQGTGTVLGDATAKSESINNSLDLIAKATDKIVGINSKMLRSLTTMSDAISGTVTEIGKLGTIGDLGTSANAFGGFLFGSSKVRDRGIQVLGGRISQAINGDLFRAYEVASRRGLFGSSTRTNTAALDSNISNQIGLIFQSMSDAILSGAEALGINMSDVQRALNTYRIEEQRISLMDLDPDEQRAELEAVFSSIFDGLVNVSIPFIRQFQQAGEGLGETLARVSTTVLVFEEAIESMGLDFIQKQVDPELFAQAAVAIADFAGGMEEFIDGYTNYISKFLTDAEQLDILGGRIGGIFSDLGLVVPKTRDGFTQLIQSLDLTTESGQQAFGTLISLSNEMDSYYSGVEAQQAQYESLVDTFLGNFYSGVEDLRLSTESQLSEVQASLVGLGLSSTTTMAQFSQEFREALPNLSQAEASEWMRVGNALADATKAANSFANALLQQVQSVLSLRNALQQSAYDLFGVATGLDQINQQIAYLEAQNQITFNNTMGSIGNVAQAANNMFEQWQDAIWSMSRFLDNLLIDSNVSPLSPQQQLNEALAQFDELVALAEGGDLDAYNELQGLISTILQLNKNVNASGSDYNAIFDYVRDMAGGIQMPDIEPVVQPVVVTNPVDINPIQLEVSDELQALYDRRDEIEAQNFASEIYQFADTVRQYMELTKQDLSTVLGDLNVSLDDIIGGLGVDLDNLDASMIASLATLSNVLGIEFTELTEQLGISAGIISDSNSLLNDALEGAILGLPTEFQDQLAPLFANLEAATSPEAQEQALLDLIAGVSGLPVEWRDQLAPFFDDIDITTEAGQQLALLEAQNSVLGDINTILSEGIMIAGFVNPDELGGGSSGTVDDPNVVVVPDPIEANPSGGIGIGGGGRDFRPIPSAEQIGELVTKTNQLITEIGGVERNTGDGVGATYAVANKLDDVITALDNLATAVRN